jgi:hypothetical protein
MNELKLRMKVQEPISQDGDGFDYLVVEIKVDDQLLADFSYYASDLGSLMQSTERNGSFYILTCWCGDPNCAGLDKGISVRYKEGFVYWEIGKPDPPRSFKFEYEAYSREIHGVIEQGNRLIRNLASTSERRIEIVPDRNEEFFAF